MMEMQLKAFPDLHIDIEQILASGDHVVVRARLTGTHKGNFAGIAPTNKSVTWRACNIVEVRNGKAIRGRIYADNATLLEQLGVLSLPRAKAAG
jgi:predicted ester cyclase